MNRLNFLLKTTFLLCCAFLLISSIYEIQPTTDVASENELEKSSEITRKKSSIEIKIYNERQQRLQNAVQDYFKNAIKKGLIVGAGVSIVQGDSILLSTGYGKRNVNKPAKINKETVFRLGSLSKGFAGVLVGKLNSDGLLNWNDNVSNYLPDFQFNDSDITCQVKLSHILSHTSGAPYHSYTDLIEADVDLKTIASKFESVQPISEPGDLYSYQNALFALSGEVTQCITGNSINQDLKTYFFEPLEMTSTSTDFNTLMASNNKAHAHRKYGKRWKTIKFTDKYFNAVAAGGINASADDMAKWMRFLLGHNQEIMSAQELSEVFEPIVEIGGNRKYYQRWDGHQASFYAYGWRIHHFTETDTGLPKTVIHHGGSVNDFRNEIALFPEEDLGISVLMNSMTKLSKQVIPDLHRIISGIYHETTPEVIVQAGYTNP
ncbi:MAG: serine hydrolase domain-containing protein, partial [Bacteroidota bacterium]